ncbi:MAG: hypothetical protein IIZ13_10275 [Renibacterium sp.]|nr:hypothetical protein [Renibacterium sp.]
MNRINVAARPHSGPLLDHSSPWRYGVFLRPGPELGRAALQAMDVAQRMFGFQAANSYPPHTTLVGSMAIDGTERGLIEVLDKTLAGRAAAPLWNRGLTREIGGGGLHYNVNEDPSGSGNQLLRELVRDLFAALEPLRVHPVTDRGIVARRQETGETFRAHLTVVGHDGIDHPEVVDECLEFLKGLDLDGPESDPGNTVSLYRFYAEDWSSRYWETMTWTVCKSWTLA